MEHTRVLGYVRVSTDDQHASGGGLAAQRTAIRSECERRGWQLVAIVGEDSGASSATLDRAGLQRVLDRLDAGEADVLVVAKLDRLSRSVAQSAVVMDRAKRRGWKFVALDLGVDTTSAAGELVANVMASVAQWERRAIGERTRAALAAKRNEGVRLGRPPVLPVDVVRRVVAERKAGRSLRVIAAGLSADGVSTARGGPVWQVSAVQSVLSSQQARAVLAATG
jgi:DNA invertase Pin-like site-specific DNA recombinase